MEELFVLWAPGRTDVVREEHKASFMSRQGFLFPVPQSSLPVLALHPLLGPYLHYLPLPSPHPQHIRGLSPGCELLGGRPSINVKCCRRLCSLANASLTCLAHPGLL